MKRLLVVPVVVLLAAVIYIFFVYDPNPSKDTVKGASVTLGEPKHIGSSEIGTTTVTDAVEFEVIPVTVPPAQESADEEGLAEVVASEEQSSSDPASSDEAESTEPSLSAAAEDTAEEAALSAAEDASTQETTTPAAVDESMEAAITTTSAAEETTASDEAVAADSSATAGSAEDDSREAVRPIEEMPSENIMADEQQPADGYIEHTAVITSSLYQATNDVGLSANQSARIGKIFKPYLDSRRELREGDKLMIFLDPGAAKTGNDAEQIDRLEFHGARKTLMVTRKENSLSDYEVRNADGEMLVGEVSQASVAVKEPRQEEPAPRIAADNNPAAGNMKRLEGVVSISLFSAAREAGLNSGQLNKLEAILTPYMNFNKDVRKGDRIVVMLDGGVIDSCEFIGAVKKLTATRGDNGTYRVTDLAGSEAAVTRSAGASSQMQGSESGQPVITQSTPLEGGEPVITQSKSPERGGDDLQVKPGQAESVPGESGDEGNSNEESSTRKPFWKRLGFGSSSAVDDSNWKPQDRKLAQVFDKVAASGKVERKALVRAFKYYEQNRKTSGLAQSNLAIADYTKLATTRRLHIINLKSANITSVQVAHGRNSGPIGGRVTSTSNANGSNKTTKGFYKVGFKEGRTSTKGYPYLQVEGLESHNRLVGLPPRQGGRDIIIHTAGYVASGGRSLGCFSIRPQDKRIVFGKLKGVLFYSYVG